MHLKKNFNEKVIEILPEGVSIAEVDICFQDEARVGQRGTGDSIILETAVKPLRTSKKQRIPL